MVEQAAATSSLRFTGCLHQNELTDEDLAAFEASGPDAGAFHVALPRVTVGTNREGTAGPPGSGGREQVQQLP